MCKQLFVLAIAACLFCSGCATRGETGAWPAALWAPAQGPSSATSLDTPVLEHYWEGRGAISGGLMGSAVDDVERQADAARGSSHCQAEPDCRRCGANDALGRRRRNDPLLDPLDQRQLPPDGV